MMQAEKEKIKERLGVMKVKKKRLKCQNPLRPLKGQEQLKYTSVDSHKGKRNE